MRAIVQPTYGGPDVLEVADLATLEPGRGEVLVAVEAAAVDRGTVHLLRGTPYLLRLGVGLRRPRARFQVPGRDVAGTVVALGPEVEGFAVGDRVHGTADGSLATHAVAPVRRLAAWPDALDAAQAAAVPVSGLTAHQAVRAARVRAGQRALVLGGSGGVGSWLVQLLVAAGVEVTASASPTSAPEVARLGAASVVGHDEAMGLTGRFDAVFAVGGNHRLRPQLRLLRRGGTLVQVGRDDDGRWTAGYLRSMGCALLSPLLRHRVVLLVAKELGSDLAEVDALIVAGRVQPLIDSTWPLDDAAAALAHLEAGGVRGKVVVTVT